MRLLIITAGVASLLLGLPDLTWAHFGDRVFPIYQLTDEDLARIDLRDGSVEEWFDIVGEATMVAFDFNFADQNSLYDPMDMDFRIWLGWHDATNRIYGAMERVDDYFIRFEGDREYDLFSLIFHDSAIIVCVDGDHSADSLPDGPEKYEMAQGYVIVGETYPGGSQVFSDNFRTDREFTWYLVPPYSDAGGSIFGERPTVSVTEFYLTPFDLFLYNSPEDSQVSKLSAGQVIGFTIWVNDDDGSDEIEECCSYLLGAPGFGVSATKYVDGLLLGEFPDDSAVESITWARIKATFVRQ